MNRLHRKLLEMLDEASDFDRDTIYMTRTMAAEMGLCYRKGVTKEQLIGHRLYHKTAMGVIEQ